MRKTNPIPLPEADGRHNPPYQERGPRGQRSVQNKPNLARSQARRRQDAQNEPNFPPRDEWWAVPTLPREEEPLRRGNRAKRTQFAGRRPGIAD
jgi:hypothetical protein